MSTRNHRSPTPDERLEDICRRLRLNIHPDRRIWRDVRLPRNCHLDIAFEYDPSDSYLWFAHLHDEGPGIVGLIYEHEVDAFESPGWRMREAMKYCDFVVVVCTYVESKCDRCGTDLGEEHGPWADEEQSLWRLKVGWNDLADKEQVFDMLASGWYNRGADTSWSEDSPIWNYRNPNQLTLQEVQ